MSKFFFSGSVSAKLDAKNRFVLPQHMRFGLVENGSLDFTMAIGLGGCLALYRKSDMDKIVQKFQAKQHKHPKFFTLFFSTLHQTTCDKVGRVSIPPILKKAAGIQSDLVVAGVLNKIELWPKEIYESNLRALMDGDLASASQEAFSLIAEEDTCGSSHFCDG